MTTIDLDILAELAKKATPGPWRLGTTFGKGLCFAPVHAPTWGEFATVVVRLEGNGDDPDGVGDWHAENARYISAVDPQTVLALIEELRGLRAFKASADEALNSGDGTYKP